MVAPTQAAPPSVAFIVLPWYGCTVPGVPVIGRSKLPLVTVRVELALTGSAAVKLKVPAMCVALRAVMVTDPAVPFRGVVHAAAPCDTVPIPPKFVALTPTG